MTIVTRAQNKLLSREEYLYKSKVATVCKSGYNQVTQDGIQITHLVYKRHSFILKG